MFLWRGVRLECPPRSCMWAGLSSGCLEEVPSPKTEHHHPPGPGLSCHPHSRLSPSAQPLTLCGGAGSQPPLHALLDPRCPTVSSLGKPLWGAMTLSPEPALLPKSSPEGRCRQEGGHPTPWVGYLPLSLFSGVVVPEGSSLPRTDLPSLSHCQMSIPELE